MNKTAYCSTMPNRKRFILYLTVFTALTATACKPDFDSASKRETPNYKGTIVAVGNSLTAGLGVSEENAYPPLLENKLVAEGFPYQVINAGISGETSSGALSRVKWVLKNLKPDIVILETGANDGLRGIDPALIQKNIRDIIKILKAENVIVILAGMRMVSNLGQDYTNTFASIFPAIADQEDLIFMPFFLEGVAGEKRYNQADGIHPNSEGYRIISNRILPYVVEAINRLPTNLK
jgi:acyl-CoA thioesterase-1